jgi:integrase
VDQKRRQAEARLLAGADWQDHGLVFTRWDGSPLDPRAITKQLHVLLAPIGLGRMRTHDLRHAYVTLLIRQGVPIPTIAKLVGHASPVMTLNVYGHVANDSLQEAAGRLNDLRLTGS